METDNLLVLLTDSLCSAELNYTVTLVIFTRTKICTQNFRLPTGQEQQ